MAQIRVWLQLPKIKGPAPLPIFHQLQPTSNRKWGVTIDAQGYAYFYDVHWGQPGAF